MNTIKILLLGKTGVGKSSFINYFLGKDVAGIGVGEPCTQERTKYTLNEWEDCSIEIYDTKGLEVLDADNWSNEISRHLHEMSELDFFERYQTIFYCISAKKKIEIYELNAIKKIIETAEQPVHIILTHCDEIDCDMLDEREEYLRKNIADNICVYRITSVDKTKRNGTVIKKNGREKVLDGVFDLLWQDVSEKFADDVNRQFCKTYISLSMFFKNEFLKLADLFGIPSILSMIINDDFEERGDKIFDGVFENLEAASDAMQEKLSQWVEDNCILPLEKIYFSYSKAMDCNMFFDADDICSIADDIIAEKGNEIMEAMDEQAFCRKMKLDFIDEEIEDESLLGMGKMILKGAGAILFLKKRFKDFIEETINGFALSLCDGKLKNEIYTKLLELRDKGEY